MPWLAILVTVTSAHAQAPAAPLDSFSITVREGTTLAMDISRDGRTIVFDLLGQLWALDAAGGEARPITDAVSDMAEDLDPSLSPDGRQLVFSGERSGRRGLWLADLEGGAPRLLSRTPDGEGFDGRGAWSPDGRTIAFVHVSTRVAGNKVLQHSEIALLDLASGDVRPLRVEGLPEPDVRDPAWSPDGARIVFVAGWVQDDEGGRVWSVPVAGGAATPVTPEIAALAPALSPDGLRPAFLAPDPAGRIQVWVQEAPGQGAAVQAAGAPRRLTDHRDVAPTASDGCPTEKRSSPQMEACGASPRRGARPQRFRSSRRSRSRSPASNFRPSVSPRRAPSSRRAVTWGSRSRRPARRRA